MGLWVTIEKKRSKSPEEGGPQARTTAGVPVPWPRVSTGLPLCICYRVFNRNLGKLIAYLSGLFLVIWAETYGKSLVCVGHFDI